MTQPDRLWETAPLPQAVYGCEDDGCASEVSYPADMIGWTNGTEHDRPGWYCETCISHMLYADGDEAPAIVTSLAAEIERRQQIA